MRSNQAITYELSNLPIAIGMGNVLRRIELAEMTTVTDKKIPVDDGNDGTIDWYVADITSVTDYYPFGSPMDGRTFSSDKYRFGFNGKEKDDEVKGAGSQQDYGMRIYDTRLGKFLSTDPLAKEYPWNSTYAFAENDVIRSVDLDGLEKYPANSSLFYVTTVGEKKTYLHTMVNERITNLGVKVLYPPTPYGPYKDPGHGWIRRSNMPQSSPDDGSGGYAPKLYAGNSKYNAFIKTAPVTPNTSTMTGKCLAGIGGIIELINIAKGLKDASEAFDQINLKIKLSGFSYNYNKAFKKAVELQNDNMKYLPENMRTKQALADVTNYALDGKMPKLKNEEYSKNIQKYGNMLIERLNWQVRSENKEKPQ